jgi:hypothetical protein
LSDTKAQLDRFSKRFWTVTQFVLRDQATFDDDELVFELAKPPANNIPAGRYHLISKSGRKNVERDEPDYGTFLYRLSHPLGEFVIDHAKGVDTPAAKVIFNVSNHPTRLHLIESLRGKQGYLTLTSLAVESYEREEYLLFSGLDVDGLALDQEACEKMFNCLAESVTSTHIPESVLQRLTADSLRHVKATISQSLEANNKHFFEAREKLEKWADDLVLVAEKALRDTKEQIKVAQRQARLATNLDEQHEIQQRIQKLEKQQRRQRQEIFQVEDDIIAKRDGLIEALEKRLTQKIEARTLFTLEWAVV